jgi:signal peptidase
MRNLSRLKNNLLTIGAVLGTLCLIGALMGILFGAKPLVFRSGSMSPSIETGALGVSLPVQAHEIRTGDIISVENTAGVRITHRVVTTEVANGTATLTLKGDANTVADPEPYVLRTADRVVFSLPFLGYGVSWLSSSAAMFVGGLFTAYLLYLAFGSRQRKRTEQPPPDGESVNDGGSGIQNNPRPKTGRRSKHKVVSVLATIGLIPVGILHTSAPGYAAFLDTASATTGTLTATSLQTPTLTCTNTDNDVLLTLTHPGGPANLYDLTSAVPARTWNTGTWSAGSVVNYVVDADNSAFTFNQATNVTFTGTSKIGLWTSPAATKVVTYTPEITVLFLGLTPPKLRCP